MARATDCSVVEMLAPTTVPLLRYPNATTDLTHPLALSQKHLWLPKVIEDLIR